MSVVGRLPSNGIAMTENGYLQTKPNTLQSVGFKVPTLERAMSPVRYEYRALVGGAAIREFSMAVNTTTLQPIVILAKRVILKQHLIDIDILVDDLVGFCQTLLKNKRKVAPKF